MGLFSGLLKIGGSLLGGILGKNDEKKAIARQNEYNDPANVRQRAEDAGFNPLLFIGPGVGQQTATGGSNFMGQAIADSSMMLADTLSSNAKAKADQESLRQQNEKLQKQINQMTLRPKTAGIYGTGAAASAIVSTAAPLNTPEIEFDTSTHQGPRPMVDLFNPTANKWVQITPGAADRLQLKSGETILAEDYEALLGELGSEVVNTPNTANEMLGYGKLFGTPPRSLSGAQKPLSEDDLDKMHLDMMRQRSQNFNAVMNPRYKQ